MIIGLLSGASGGSALRGSAIDAGTPILFLSGTSNTEKPPHTRTLLVPQARVALNGAAVSARQPAWASVENRKKKKTEKSSCAGPAPALYVGYRTLSERGPSGPAQAPPTVGAGPSASGPPVFPNSVLSQPRAVLPPRVFRAL